MNLRKEIKKSKYEVSKSNRKYIRQMKEAFVKGWLMRIEREMDEINMYRRGSRRFKRITPCIFISLSEQLFKTTPVEDIVKGEKANQCTLSSQAKEKST